MADSISLGVLSPTALKKFFSMGSDDSSKTGHDRLRRVLSGAGRYAKDRDLLSDLYEYLTDIGFNNHPYDMATVLTPFPPRSREAALFAKSLLASVGATASRYKKCSGNMPLAKLLPSLQTVGEHLPLVMDGARFASIGNNDLGLMFSVYENLSIAAGTSPKNSEPHKSQVLQSLFVAIESLDALSIAEQGRATFDFSKIGDLLCGRENGCSNDICVGIEQALNDRLDSSSPDAPRPQKAAARPDGCTLI